MDAIENSGNSHWIPLSDMMTGLMMIFMLLAALFMLRVEQTTTLVVQEHVKTKKDLLRALQTTFKKDTQQWNAKFLGDMTLQFNNPDVLFDTGKSELKPEFKVILDQLMPRYVNLLTDKKFKDSIKEIRIEGRTSKFWGTADEQTAYFHNMELSQSRTRAALEYILQMPSLAGQQAWLESHFTAVGLSSSRPIKKADGSIDDAASQSVDFRIITNAEERMDKIATDLEKK